MTTLLSYAVANPWTMMVVGGYTEPTLATVFGAKRLLEIAASAVAILNSDSFLLCAVISCLTE